MPEPVCKCCGQTLPPKLNLGIKLTPRQQRLVERVHRAGPHGILSTDLFDYIYGADPNGGPEGGVKAMSTWIFQINKRLKKVGKRVRAPVGGQRCHTNYVLETIE